MAHSGWLNVAQSCLHIGLTGGIGSGKSTVAKFLEKFGAAIIDADAISRAATATNGSAIQAIADTFGEKFIASDGSLDRNRMRELAYADPRAKRKLEAIVHPIVQESISRQAVAAVSRGARCVVYDIPLLVESGHWRGKLDKVLVVDCSREAQAHRVQQRDCLPQATINAILAAQAPRQARLSCADIVIFNDGIGISQLETLVCEVWDRFGL